MDARMQALSTEHKSLGKRKSPGLDEEDEEYEEVKKSKKPRTRQDVVDYLAEKFAEQFHKRRSQTAPSELRQSVVDSSKPLSNHMGVPGRDGTLQQFVHWLAIIYKRWVNRGGEDSDTFYRGLAHMLLLSSPGAGETTFLVNLLSKLRTWLDGQEEDLWHFIRRAMYSNFVLSDYQKTVVQGFLDALKGLAGKSSKWSMMFLLRVDEDQDASLERDKGLFESCASAIRLLHASLSPLDHASLSPLDPSEERQTYAGFLQSLDLDIVKSLSLSELIEFWRTALTVPRSEMMLVVPLIDEANAATGTFVPRDSETATWVKELLSEVICDMSHNSKKPPTLIVPLTATTQWTAVDLGTEERWTVSWRSQAGLLSVRALQTPWWVRTAPELAE
ncbi:hypothetical protein COCOBI_12-1070 [Coccomyxa sp. Obi]|nr:hypothetical protein COCOBI_12-1070 [Coccomyxa sp. Obi]